MPSNSFHKLTEGLSHAQTSIIIQLMSGHIALNSYLHRITKNCIAEVSILQVGQ